MREARMMTRGMRGTIGVLAVLGCLAIPGSASAAILWDQNSGGDGTGFFSQTDSSPAEPDLSRAADDFIVPGGATWNIRGLAVSGHYDIGSATATSVNIRFYLDGGTVPDVAVVHQEDNVVPVQGLASGDFVIPVTGMGPLSPVADQQFWVSVQANGLDHPTQVWDWDNRPLQATTDPSAAQTIFAGVCGMSPGTWTAKSIAGCAGVGAPPDLMFSLSDVTPTAPPPGGGGGTVMPTPTPTAAPPKKCKKGQKLRKGKCVKKKRKKKRK
jgi:hypothetical protein